MSRDPLIAPILNQLSQTVVVQCQAYEPGVQLEKGTPRLHIDKECHRTTAHGNLCWQHSSELLGVRVAPSNIADAGDGLFATRPFDKGDVICEYSGLHMTRAAFAAHPSAYAVGLYNHSVIDARRSDSGFARYANAAQYKKDVNGQLLSEAKVVKKGSGKKVYLQATKHIDTDQEIVISYGRQFHRENPLPPGARAV